MIWCCCPGASYPAIYKDVVSVGAVEVDHLGQVTDAWFSNANREVDVCADGWNVLSSIPGNKLVVTTKGFFWG